MFDKMEMLNYPNGIIVYKRLSDGALFKLVAEPIPDTQDFNLVLVPFVEA